MDDELLTPSQVAERLKLSVKTVYLMLAPGGKLHELRIDLGPKAIRVRSAALDRYLSRGAANAIG